MPAKKKTKKDAHLWRRDPDDWYVEPRWCSEALFAKEFFFGRIVDPACGIGRVLDAASAASLPTFGLDIKERGEVGKRHPFMVADFRERSVSGGSEAPYENIVSNPPYKYDDEFVQWAVNNSRRKTALLLRAQWANGSGRSKMLERMPLRRVLMLTPRPSMPPGRVVQAMKGKDPSGGTQDYAWFIFDHAYDDEPGFGWIRRKAA